MEKEDYWKMKAHPTRKCIVCKSRTRDGSCCTGRLLFSSKEVESFTKPDGTPGHRVISRSYRTPISKEVTT